MERDLITESLEHIQPHGDRVAAYFYARLFMEAPELRELFPPAMDLQRDRLFAALVRLIQGRISLKSLSGPITIYQIAGEEGRKGADFFIWAMALISINLGLFNLLPIPVLDGGHLLFLTIEGVLRRPLPLRVREVAYVLGMFILLSLMVLAFKNDLEKRWDAGSESQRLK